DVAVDAAREEPRRRRLRRPRERVDAAASRGLRDGARERPHPRRDRRSPRRRVRARRAGRRRRAEAPRGVGALSRRVYSGGRMSRFARRRPALLRPEPLSFVLDRAGESRFTRERAPIPGAVWADAVGARVADRARPFALERGTLVVRAATSVWAT